MTLNSWIMWIAGGAYLLLLGALATLLVVNADLRATLASADAARSLLQAQNKLWAQKVAGTNAALAKIKTAESIKAKAIVKAEAAAQSAATAFESRATQIAALKFSGSDCEQVTSLTKYYLKIDPVK